MIVTERSGIFGKSGLPAFLVAASASGVGKTTFCLGLICALQSLGLSVLAAKTGPDFIDTAWLARATGYPVANLDARMTPGKRLPLRLLRRIFAIASKLARPTLIIEGAMGLYDGDKKGRGSCAELAARLGVPYVLLLDAAKRGQTNAALAQGLLDYRPAYAAHLRPARCAGLLCTGVGSASHSRLLESALLPVLKKRGVPFLGCLPPNPGLKIPSRHLGLLQAEEAQLPKDEYARWILDNIRLEQLPGCADAMSVQRPESRPDEEQLFACAPPVKRRRALVVAIARDAAFSFYYADLPALLADLGARTIFFSPLADERLPECDGIYIPGGYPELYLDRLCQNRPLMAAIRVFARQRPVYGECGGYIYLGKTFRDREGREWPTSGVLPVSFRMGEKLAALGYRSATPCAQFPGTEIKAVYGHEFHYAQIEQGCAAHVWQTADSQGRSTLEGAWQDCAIGSWIHLYPEGSKNFWQWWLRQCARQSRILATPR